MNEIHVLAAEAAAKNAAADKLEFERKEMLRMAHQEAIQIKNDARIHVMSLAIAPPVCPVASILGEKVCVITSSYFALLICNRTVPSNHSRDLNAEARSRSRGRDDGRRTRDHHRYILMLC